MAYKKLTRDEFNDRYEITDGKVYIVAGCNTYEIKDQLKEKGAKFYSGINWFFNQNTLPADLQTITPNIYTIAIEVEKIFNADGTYVAGALDAIQAEIKQKTIEENKAKYGASEHVGEVGQRLRNMKGIFISARYFEGQWGGSFVYTFKVKDNIFTWFTQKVLDFEENDEIDLTGTVKNHTEYNGVLQTQLSRCIVKGCE